MYISVNTKTFPLNRLVKSNATSTKIWLYIFSILDFDIFLSYNLLRFIDYQFTSNPFSGQVFSAGKLLHNPLRLSTSMTTVLLLSKTYTFLINEIDIWHLKIFLGSLLFARSAYQIWPTYYTHSLIWLFKVCKLFFEINSIIMIIGFTCQDIE